jgi:hypothetical protein
VGKVTKTEEVLKACCEIEIDLDNNRVNQAEGKLMNLCGILAKGTKYQGEIDRLGDLYLKVWRKGEIWLMI